MSIPAQSVTIQDPGLGLAVSIPDQPCFIGVCSSGTAAQIESLSKLSDVTSTLGYGPLAEAVAFALAQSGGPILALKVTSTAGSNGAVSKTAIGSSTGTITISGNPYDSYECVIEITASGTNGVGRFKYSLDDGRNYTSEITIPAGGAYNPVNTGLTFTFVPGVGATAFEDGDTHEFDSVNPTYSTANLSTAWTTLVNSAYRPGLCVFTGIWDTGSNSATMAAAVATHMSTLETNFKYGRAMLDAGSSDTAANCRTAYTAFSDTRVDKSYGTCDHSTAIPFAGWGTPKFPIINQIAARAVGSLISTHLGRVADGALPSVAPISNTHGTPISHDEFQTETMDVLWFSTLRTWPGRSGYFITRARLSGGAGSDYQQLHYGRLMDKAASVVQLKLQTYENSSVRTNSDGTIDERDAVRIESVLNQELSIHLLEPYNAEGTKGHVSSAAATVDRTNNILTSSTLQVNVSIRPNAYVELQTIVLGFVGAQ